MVVDVVFTKINHCWKVSDFMSTHHHFSNLSDISYSDLIKYVNDYGKCREAKRYDISDKIRKLLYAHGIEIRNDKNNIIVKSNKIFGFNFTSQKYIDFSSNELVIIEGTDSDYDGCVYDLNGFYHSIKCIYTNADTNQPLYYEDFT